MPVTMKELGELKAQLKAQLNAALERLNAELERLRALTRPPFAIAPFVIKPKKRKPMQTLSAFRATKKTKKRMSVQR